MSRSGDASDHPRRGRPHRPHLDPPLGGRIMRVERLRSSAPRASDAGGGSRRDARPLEPEEGALPGDENVLLELATAPIKRMARIVYSSNAAFVVELDARDPVDSTQPLRAVYKPARGERPLWDFPHHTLHFRETATYQVDAALGFGLVPPTIVRDGPLGAGSLQLFVDVAERDLSDSDADTLDPLLRDVAALDVLINNADRKRAHLLVTRDGRLRGIDHGLTFLPYPRQRTVLIDLGGSPLPDSTAARVTTLARDPVRHEALCARLARLLAPPEVDAFGHRLAELAGDPVYPVLDPWDGRPFEWW